MCVEWIRIPTEEAMHYQFVAPDPETEPCEKPDADCGKRSEGNFAGWLLMLAALTADSALWVPALFVGLALIVMLWEAR